MQRRVILCGAILLAAGVALSQQADFSSIPRFRKINSLAWTGGQPKVRDFGRLKSLGITTIITLRLPSEFDATEEAAAASRLGLRYFLVPVDDSAPADAQVEAFLALMEDPANRPVFIHCRKGARVGAFWMIRRVLVEGWSEESAEQEAESIGLDSPELRSFARSYIARHRNTGS